MRLKAAPDTAWQGQALGGLVNSLRSTLSPANCIKVGFQTLLWFVVRLVSV